MDVRESLLADHARVHSAQVNPPESPAAIRLGSLVVRGSIEDLTARSEGHNSVAWLMWHMARCEDVAINRVLRRQGEVLDDPAWSQRLGIDHGLIGTGQSDDEVDDFTKCINLEALLEYRDAVGRSTQEFIKHLDPATLGDVVDVEAVLADQDFLHERGKWVGQFWRNRDRAWFLSWLAIGHNYYHLGEAEHVRRMFGSPGP